MARNLPTGVSACSGDSSCTYDGASPSASAELSWSIASRTPCSSLVSSAADHQREGGLVPLDSRVEIGHRDADVMDPGEGHGPRDRARSHAIGRRWRSSLDAGGLRAPRTSNKLVAVEGCGRVSIMADPRTQRVYPLDAAIAETAARPDDDPRAWAPGRAVAMLVATVAVIVVFGGVVGGLNPTDLETSWATVVGEAALAIPVVIMRAAQCARPVAGARVSG